MAQVSIKKNVAYQTVYEILVVLLPLITSPYIARVLGAENLGIYSYTYSVANYFVIFAMLGIKNHGNRSIAAVRDDANKTNEVFSNLFFLHTAISVICIVLYIFYLMFVVTQDMNYAMIQMFLVVGALFDINWFFFGIEKFQFTVMRNIIIKVANVAAIFIFVHDSDDLWKYTLIMAFGNFLSQLILWFTLKKYVSFVKPKWSLMKIHIKPMLMLFVPVIAISLYKYMDKIMLGNLTTKFQLGFYENSEKAINIPLSVITAFGTVMLPRMSNILANEKANHNKKSSEYIKISMRYIMMIAIAMAFGMASVADTFSVIFWGFDFSECGMIIFLLSVTIPFTAFANIIRTQYLIPTKKDKMYILSVVLGAVVNFIINYLLIGKYGSVGAAIGTIAAEITVCIMQSGAVAKELPLMQYIKSFIGFLIPGCVMYGVVKIIDFSFPSSFLLLIAEVMIGGAVYILLSALILILIRDRIFIEFLSKKGFKIK